MNYPKLLLAPVVLCVFVTGHDRLAAADRELRPVTEAEAVAAMKKRGGKFLAKGFKSSWSPDAMQIVYGGGAPAGGDELDGGIHILDLKTGKTRQIAKTGKDPAWSPNDGNHVAYVAGGYGTAEQIWLVKSAGGQPRRLADGGFPSWSSDGKKLFYHSRKRRKLMTIQTDAKDAKPVELMDMQWRYPAISPGDKYVVYRQNQLIMVADLETSKNVKQLPVQGGGVGFLGGWSPDGTHISYGGYGAHDVVGLWVIHLKTGKATNISQGSFTMSDWSRDGSKIAFDLRASGGREIWMIETKSFGGFLVKKDKKPDPVDPKIIDLWIKQLGDPKFKTREQATLSLIQAGSSTLEALNKAKSSDDAEVRNRASTIIKQIEKNTRFGDD